MPWTSNPGRDADRYEEMQEQKYLAWLETRPTCCICGFRIESDYAYKSLGDWFCEDCVTGTWERIPD